MECQLQESQSQESHKDELKEEPSEQEEELDADDISPPSPCITQVEKRAEQRCSMRLLAKERIKYLG